MYSTLVFVLLVALTVFAAGQGWRWDLVGNKVYHHGFFGSAAEANISSDGLSAATVYQVVIGYAGWNVSSSQSQPWVQTLNSHTSFGYPNSDVYAVGGPADPSYSGKEIGNSKLIADLTGRIRRYAGQGKKLGRVIVLGHSSGSFVAHEFLQQLPSLDKQGLIRGKVDYFNLDGGGTGLSAGLISSVTHYCYFTYAYNSRTNTYSPNVGSMKALQGSYGNTGKTMLIQNDASGSQCNGGAVWCVHIALINNVPWNHAGAAPWLDYTRFSAPHTLSTAFLSKLKR